MIKVLHIVPVLVALAGFCLLAGLPLHGAEGAQAQTPGSENGAVAVLEGARLIDGTGRAPLANSVLVVKGDRIVGVGAAGKVSVPAGAHKIDVHGRTIMPGLINAHGHLGLVWGLQNSAEAYTRENVEQAAIQYEEYGVTSILSLGVNRDLLYQLRDEQHRGAFPGTSIFTAGRGIGVLNGLPPFLVAPDQMDRPTTPEEARAAVRETAAHHADMIKMWVDDAYGRFPKMKPEVYLAVIDEAHRQKVRVAVHVFYLADAKALVSAGADVLAHSIRDKVVDAELIATMKERGVWYIPTFTVEESQFIYAENPSLMQEPYFVAAASPEVCQQLNSDEYRKKILSDPNLPKTKAALAMSMENLKTLRDAGVHIAMGTDSGANFSRLPGWAEHHELELMVKAGLTPMETIVTATQGAAVVLGTKDRGTLEAGKRADFLILAKNPLDDITNTKQIVMIWHGGKQIAPRVGATASEATSN